MKRVEILIEGNPVPKGRPKFSVRGGFARAYTPAKTRAYEEIVRQQGIVAMEGSEPLETPLNVSVRLFMQIPKSFTKAQKAKAYTGELAHTKKPDLDNLAKVLDGLNGVVWKDDSQIVRMVLEKRYSDYPRTEIVVSEVF